MVIAAMLTSLTVAREWERGTMEQLIATPVKPGELILGKLVPYFAIGMCDVAVAVLMAEFVFHVPLARQRGPAVRHVGHLSGRGAGDGVAGEHRHQEPVVRSQVAVLTTFLPGFLLSGFVFTIANMPQAIQMVTYLISARYFVTILKGIYLKGVGLEILGGQAVFLIVYAAAMVILAQSEAEKEIGVRCFWSLSSFPCGGRNGASVRMRTKVEE